MSDDFREGEIIFLRFMRFPDDNSIDYRMNGRPYLVYKVGDGIVYLFKIGRSRVQKDSYYPIKLQNKGKTVECYVDLRYMIAIDKEELTNKMFAMHSENKAYRNSSKRKILDKKDWKKIKEKIEFITAMNELEIIAKNYDLIFKN